MVASEHDATRGPAKDPIADGSNTTSAFEGLFVDRVRLYLKVMFIINVFLGLLRLTVDLFVDDLGGRLVTIHSHGIAATVTVLNGLVWWATKRGRPSTRTAIGIEAVATLFLTAYYTRLVFLTSNGVNLGEQWIVLLLATIVLVLRSSLVPSPTFATFFLGCFVVAGVVMGTMISLPMHPSIGLVWLGAMGLIVVSVTTLTSSTIYGLQREMLAAKRLGQYQLGEKIGEGGMGEVFLAQHSMLQRKTAVKLLRSSKGTEARARFRREVQTASSLSHPNTIEIYDYGRTPDGEFYFAMEYVEGATLSDLVRATGPVPAERVMHIVRQAAGSLGEAHGRGLVHRDVKPQNLMLCERGGLYDTVKVLDFGLVQDVAEPTPEERLTGTPLYLAPEAILEADGFIAESDVYALGAVAYTLLTGQAPFEGELLDILSDHLSTAPRALPHVEGYGAFTTLVMRCLSKDPGDRPSSALVFLEELDECENPKAWSHQDAALWWAEHGEVVERGPSSAIDQTGFTSASNRRRCAAPSETARVAPPSRSLLS